uniref:Uncharacterized protein n=1 Tax=Ralstonia solanacearum TaxID=305 RepID=A0A0S4U0H8_RALSL|nr:protein of unknown function [Ralstonia solanacearum]
MERRNGYAASRMAAPGGAFCLKAAALRHEPGPVFVHGDSGVPAPCREHRATLVDSITPPGGPVSPGFP